MCVNFFPKPLENLSISPQGKPVKAIAIPVMWVNLSIFDFFARVSTPKLILSHIATRMVYVELAPFSVAFMNSANDTGFKFGSKRCVFTRFLTHGGKFGFIFLPRRYHGCAMTR